MVASEPTARLGGADASPELDAPGFDLMALFTGSEGMLGIVTEVTVKLLPTPRGTNTPSWWHVDNQRYKSSAWWNASRE